MKIIVAIIHKMMQRFPQKISDYRGRKKNILAECCDKNKEDNIPNNT